MDDLPLGPALQAQLSRRATLALLVGRVTTVKLAFWASLTAVETLLPLVFARPFSDRFPASIALTALISAVALFWARHAARAPDRGVGYLSRSIPTIATTFAVTTVVASPASLPLLIVERQRSLESCGGGACHLEALVLWVALMVVGTVLIPAVFAASIRGDDRARSLWR